MYTIHGYVETNKKYLYIVLPSDEILCKVSAGMVFCPDSDELLQASEEEVDDALGNK